MKKRIVVVAVFTTLLAVANAQVNSSSNASVSSNNSVSANKSGTTVQSENSANASEQTSVNTPKSNNGTKNVESSNSSRANSFSSAGLNGGSTLNVVLAKPIDSRKAKPGDDVVATASQDMKSDDKVVIQKGSKLVGHVTQAQARSEGAANSSLGIVFDHAVLKNGQQVPVHGVVQALAAGQTNSSTEMGDDSLQAMGGTAATGTGAVRSGGGLVGRVGSTVNTATTGAVANTSAVTRVASSTTGAVAGSGHSLQGVLNSSSTGVIGMQGFSLESPVANSAQGSIISSTGKSVHLDSGTQMVLRLVSQ
jgi:hypothetical protein